MSISRVKKMGGLAFHQLERAAAFLDRSFRELALFFAPDPKEREARHWARPPAPMILTWQDHPVIRAWINRRVSGLPDKNWLEYVGEEFGPFEHALNLGCGFGALESHAFSRGLVQRFHSLDLSEIALEKARINLEGQPVVFEKCDLNEVHLPAETYDAVFAASSLHHLLQLERLLDEVAKALKPGGLFIFDEFVGPSRFQWPGEQLSVVNEVLVALPRRYRKNLRGVGYKNRVYRAPLDATNRDSPFEAIRSQEILPLVRQRFSLLLQRDYGGALLHPLLDGIAGNFRVEREEDTRLLSRLADLELKLEQAGKLASDFTVVVARKK